MYSHRSLRAILIFTPMNIFRAQSVFDDRSFGLRGSRLERTNSIKEHDFGRSGLGHSMGRRWASRDSLFGHSTEPSSSYSVNPVYSSGSSGSSLYGRDEDGKLSSRGWANHVSMVQEDVKTRLNSAKALVYGESF